MEARSYIGRWLGKQKFVTGGWYRLAAEQEYASAQTNLGFMYANSSGVPKNRIKAHSWFSIAEELGQVGSAEIKDTIAKGMTRQQIAEAQALSKRCFENNYEGCD